jgi:hypothetical protein
MQENPMDTPAPEFVAGLSVFIIFSSNLPSRVAPTTLADLKELDAVFVKHAANVRCRVFDSGAFSKASLILMVEADTAKAYEYFADDLRGTTFWRAASIHDVLPCIELAWGAWRDADFPVDEVGAADPI